MENGLKLALLGKLEIRLADVTVAGLTSAKAQALLCYLAVTGRPHFRTSLAGLLWGDMPETNARTNLRRELSTLRRTVGEHLTITRQEVAFNRDAPHWLDVEVFEAAVGQGTIKGLREAVELYRGDFLEGFYVRDAPAFEEWALVQATRLRELALQALHKLSVHYAEQGEAGLEEGITYTSRLLALEPSREEAHRGLMLLLAQSGQRGAALAQYAVCSKALAEDLGVEPGPETRELYARIRDGELRREPPLTRPPKLPSERVVDLPEFLTGARVEPDRPVFVARERELTRLDGYLENALAGQGQVVFVTGGPGRGKTALMIEFARRAMDQYPQLLLGMGNCDAYSGIGDPYLPFREVLGMLTGDVESRWVVGAISREHACRLWRAVPLASRALLDHGPYLIGTLVPSPGLLSRAAATVESESWLQELQAWAGRERGEHSDLEQSAIFEQYTNVLRALAQQHPLLLLFDDLQWTDTASAGLLFHLGRRLAGARILIVGAYRPEEVAFEVGERRHSLEKPLGEFKRQYGDVWLDLSHTEETEGRRFLDALLATEPNRLGEDFRNELIKHTGGHALFTVELLQTMQERGDLVRDGHGAWTEGPVVDWGTLPARVEAVIEERIARLSPELRDILTIASVEGEAFTAQVVARVQEKDERDVFRVLSQELEKRHRLVREQGGLTVDGKRLSRYRFAHALFQEYLHCNLSEGERALLHWDVGAALEELHAGQTDEIAVELSHHYAIAGDSERERHYARLAGERAAAQYAHDEAGRYLSRALDLTPETNYDERFALLLAREEVYSFQGDRESQAAGLAALDQLIEALDTDEPAAAKRAEIALRHAKYAEATHDLSAGIKASRMAIDYARTAQDVRAEAEGYFLWGLLLDKNGDMAAARPKFEQGLALAQAVDARMIEASCVRALGWICCDQGDFDESEAYLSKSLSISREIGDLLGEARALHHLGSTLSLKYGVTAATDYFQQAIMICRKIGHRSGQADTLATDGWQSLYMGDSARSEASFQAALKILHEAGKPDLQANVLGGLGRLYREYVGDFERARACGEEALRLAQEVGSLFNEAIGEFNIGFALHYQGDYSSAEVHMQRFLRIMCGNRGWLAHGALGRVGVGLNAIALGEYPAALAHLERARSTFREFRLDNTDDGAWAQSALALLYHQLGEDQTAREYATRALTIHRKSGYDYRTATALTRLGHALTALRDLAEAAAAYQEALDLRRQMGQRHLAPEPLAGLARVALARDDPAAALAHVEEILSHLTTGSVDGTDEPMQIYLTCYRVLRANEDPRAEEVLVTAHDLLQERAAKIDDDDLRRSFFENVTANRELVAEWKDLSDCRHAAAV